MTELSPKTQRVLQLANDAVEALPLDSSPVSFSLVLIAAALEALADQVVPDGPDPEALLGPGFVFEVKKQLKVRSEILAIAAELRAQ